MSLQDREGVVDTIIQTGFYLIECGPSFSLVASDSEGRATLWAKAKGDYEQANLSLEPYVERLRELARLRRGATQECCGLVFKFDGPLLAGRGIDSPDDAPLPTAISRHGKSIPSKSTTALVPRGVIRPEGKPKTWADLFK